jgi:branched-chain amino acid transport system substrate-binding protein
MLALAPIAQRYGVPVVSPSATNPKVTQVGDYIFRVCFIDPYQGKILAKFVRESLKAKRIAVLRDVRNDYSIGLADYFTAAFTAAGGEVVSDQRYSGGDIDFRAQLTAVRTAAPDALFVPGYYTEVGLISRQARELGLKLPLVGGDGWSSPSLVEVGGRRMGNAFFADHFALEDTTPVVKDFIARFKKVYGHDPNGSAALGYDAAKVILDAVRRAGSESPKAIRDALASTRDFPGATGKISIDPERNAAKPAVMLKVENGAIRFHSNVTL